MQRDAALSALSAMQELFGSPPESIPTAADLLVVQTKALALETAASQQAELARLRAELTKLRVTEAATREFARTQLHSLSRVAASLCSPPPSRTNASASSSNSSCAAEAASGSSSAVEGHPALPTTMRKELLAVCEHVRRELEAGPLRNGVKREQSDSSA
jgi:hypothetical protein